MSASTQALTIREGRLFRFEQPHQILAGSIHYFRVHPDQWSDRLQRVADLGLNTVDTYVPWNFHQPAREHPADFTGWRDLGRFLDLAADLNLDAIVRPGPYICAEWTNGGLPAWVTTRHRALRSSHPEFLQDVAAWFDHLMPAITRRQAVAGGRVVAVQVENEYGSYGADHEYMRAIERMLSDRGVVELRYTSDGPEKLMLDGGTLDGVLAAVNFGSRTDEARDAIRSRRSNMPFFCGELWNGWFDHWGEHHNVRAPEGVARTLSDIVRNDGSVSIYMAHGGTNFGVWAGANDIGGRVSPTVTSYDSDAPIAEDGTLTEKFEAIRRTLGATSAVVADPPRFLPAQQVDAEHGADLLEAVSRLAGTERTSFHAATFESVNIDAPLVMYDTDIHLPGGPITLHLPVIRDRAQVFLDHRMVGTIEEGGSLQLTPEAGPYTLSLLIENVGRINYGPRLGEPKGLLETARLDYQLIQRWRLRPVSLDEVSEPQLSRLVAVRDTVPGPGMSFATLRADTPADAHVALPGFVRGFVWINSFLLGRYRAEGPQRTLYVPAPLLRSGDNRISILELESRGTHIELSETADLGPQLEFVEPF